MFKVQSKYLTPKDLVSQKLVHGNCRVQYTVSPGVVTKGVSHLKDCSNRVYRYNIMLCQIIYL